MHAEQAEDGRAGAVPGVVGEVPQGTGLGLGQSLDQQRERRVLDHPEPGAEQHHAREQRHGRAQQQHRGHAERRHNERRDERAGVTMPVAEPAGLPAAERGRDRLDEQGGRAEVAWDPVRERQERVEYTGRGGRGGEDQRQPRCAGHPPAAGARHPPAAGARRPLRASGLPCLAPTRQPADGYQR